MSENKLMLIDGNSLLFRAFYALPLLHNSEGVYTNGVYGFLTMYNRVIAEEKPSHVLVAFDKDKKTFRTDIYAEYKANRSAPPDELIGQFQLIRDILKAMNVDYIELDGYEADDLIGTISKRAEQEGFKTLIVTGDGDALQLVSNNTLVMMTRTGITNIDLYDPAKVIEKWEVPPEQMIEIKALMGDTSDNIPGVPGVGPKTAIKLIKEFSNLENLYDNLDKVNGKKLKERLEENREQAFLSRKLATIERNIDLDIDFDEFKVKSPDIEKLAAIYKKLEFNNFLKGLEEQMNETQAEEVVSAEVEINNIDSEESSEKLIELIKKEKEFSFLLDCDYHHPMWNKLKGIYIKVEDRVFHLGIGEKTTYQLEWIRGLLESDLISKYTHNAKFAQVVFLRYGIKLEGVAGDTLLLAYVNDPVFQGEELSDLVSKFLKLSIPTDNLAMKVNYLFDLHATILEETPQDLLDLYYDVELPLSNILGYMEFYGVKVDKDTLTNISQELEVGIDNCVNNIYRLAQREFNINSPKQLGQVLFEELGLRVIKKTKTGYATGVEILEQLY
ncbi:MAG: DNA polymerase I, partial [Syntrophomonadaceae bacterium]|nr:DNA polymerase I [Syntrophomonadaceae bacterium]